MKEIHEMDAKEQYYAIEKLLNAIGKEAYHGWSGSFDERARAMGLLMARHSNYSRRFALLAAGEALEDGNFHETAETVRDLV